MASLCDLGSRTAAILSLKTALLPCNGAALMEEVGVKTLQFSPWQCSTPAATAVCSLCWPQPEGHPPSCQDPAVAVPAFLMAACRMLHVSVCTCTQEDWQHRLVERLGCAASQDSK